MLDEILRPPKERLLVPAARLTQRVHPTALTLVAFGVGVLAVVAVLAHTQLVALMLWLANRFLDGLDGSAARFQHKQSDVGGYLDILLDMVIYAALPLALVVASPSPARYLSLAFLLAAYYVNSGSWLYLAALLEKRQQGAGVQGEKTSITMPSGLIEGAETVVVYCIFLIWPGQLVLLFCIFAALVMVTVGQRVLWALATLR
jgi:phosphatidylglycerophosphate synthase